MSLYSIALFLHVVGALGFFIALGLEWVSLQQIQRATTVEQVGEWFKATSSWRGIAGISMLVILVAGFYMTFAAWGGADWIEVAFGAFVVHGALSGILTSPRMRAIQKSIASERGPISPEFDRLLHYPLLWVSLLSRTGIALGIVFLMTVKPTLVGSLMAMAVAIILSLALAAFTMGTKRTQGLTA